MTEQIFVAGSAALKEISRFRLINKLSTLFMHEFVYCEGTGKNIHKAQPVRYCYKQRLPPFNRYQPQHSPFPLLSNINGKLHHYVLFEAEGMGTGMASGKSTKPRTALKPTVLSI